MAAAIAYAVIPAVRRRIGWLVVALAIVGPATAWLAKQSGEALQERMPSVSGYAEPLAHVGYGQSCVEEHGTRFASQG